MGRSRTIYSVVPVLLAPADLHLIRDLLGEKLGVEPARKFGGDSRDHTREVLALVDAHIEYAELKEG